MKFREAIHKSLIHIYMFASILATFTIFIDQEVSSSFYTIGARSWLIAIGLASAETTPAILTMFLVLWFFAFPILLVVFYILACKEIYIPFCIVTSIDTLISILCYVQNRIIGYAYGAESAIPDAIISTLFSVALITTLISIHLCKTKDCSPS